MDRLLDLSGRLLDVVTPAVAMGLLLSSAYAVAFRTIFAGRGGRLLVLIAFSAVGFVLGQALPFSLAADGPRLGEIRLLEASIGSLGLLLLARRLNAW